MRARWPLVSNRPKADELHRRETITCEDFKDHATHPWIEVGAKRSPREPI